MGEKINAGAVLNLASLEVPSGKTKDFVKAVSEVTDAQKVLIVGAEFTEETYRAERNLTTIKLQTAEEVNVEEILFFDVVVIVDDALETLAKRTA